MSTELPDSECDLSFWRLYFHCSRHSWHWGLQHPTQHFVLHNVSSGLSAVAWPWKPISFPFWLIVLMPTCSLKVLKFGSHCSDWRQSCSHTVCCSAGLSLSISLLDVSLHDMTVILPCCFHLTVASFAVEWGTFSKAQILLSDLWRGWSPLVGWVLTT